MRFVDTPTRDAPWGEHPGDDLDGLLKAYFQEEMPSPWPGAPDPEELSPLTVSPLPRRRHSLWNSRYALAASVALLLAGGWLLSGRFQDLGTNSSASTFTDETATTEDGRPVKMKISLPLKSGKLGVQIDIHEAGKDELGKDDLGLPPE
jgi:hypothetical protein